VTEVELQEVTDLLLISNTPPFFYRSLKRLNAVVNLTQKPVVELREQVFRRMRTLCPPTIRPRRPATPHSPRSCQWLMNRF
jgi:hypothetical protein